MVMLAFVMIGFNRSNVTKRNAVQLLNIIFLPFQMHVNEALSVHWTPSDHMFMYHHVTETKASWSALSSALRPLTGKDPVEEEAEEDQKTETSTPTDSSIHPTKSRTLNLSLELKSSSLSACVGETNFIVLQADALSISKTSGSLHAKTPRLVFNFDGKDIFTFSCAEMQVTYRSNTTVLHCAVFCCISLFVITLRIVDAVIQFQFQFYLFRGIAP